MLFQFALAVMLAQSPCEIRTIVRPPWPFPTGSQIDAQLFEAPNPPPVEADPGESAADYMARHYTRQLASWSFKDKGPGGGTIPWLFIPYWLEGMRPAPHGTYAVRWQVFGDTKMWFQFGISQSEWANFQNLCPNQPTLACPAGGCDFGDDVSPR